MKSSIIEKNDTTSSENPFQSEEESLRAVVQERPQNGRAMAKLACLLVDQAKLVSDDPGRRNSMLDEAMEWTNKSIQVAPEKPFGYMSLSVLEKDHSQRMTALRKAIEYHPEDETNFSKLALLIRLLREPIQEQARQACGQIGKAAARHPNRRPLNEDEEKLYAQSDKGLEGFWTNRDTTDKQQQSIVNQHEMAMNEYRLGIFFRKRLPADKSRPRAQRHFLRAMEYLPQDHESSIASKFWLATLGHVHIERCPPSYVIGLYSTFAETFDNLLVGKLSYRTPTIMRELVDQHVSHQFTRGLDCGCGTGLSGIAFRDKVQEDWIGVDLSPEMIAKARERQCYDGLLVGDVTSCLSDQKADYFDFVLACDVLVYLGDLQSVLDGVHRVLKTNGIFAFSTELLQDSDSNKEKPDFVLHECARFSHSRAYIERLASSATASFEVLCMEKRSLRKNQGEDVMGNLAILKKL